MEHVKKNIKVFPLIPFLIALLLILSIFAYIPSRAEEQTDTVLSDLSADPDFDATEYDNLIQHPDTELIQIAESTDNRLYFYMHFVGDIKDIEKIVISISDAVSESDFKSYDVDKVGSSGKFCKYVVKDLTAPKTTHTYLISRVDYPVERPAVGDQQVTYEYIPVEQIWTVTRSGDKIEYSYEYIKTITVTEKYVGITGGQVHNWFGQVTEESDIYYIAFSTDMLMEDLLEAQIEYTENEYNYVNQRDEVIGTEVKNVVVRCDDEVYIGKDTYDYWAGVAWNSGTERHWTKSICTPADFKKNMNVDVPKRADGSEYDWIVVFFSRVVDHGSIGVKPYPSITYPANTSILRLKFETAGTCYNLGVLDNRASYVPQKIESGINWFLIILLAILSIPLLILLIKFLPAIIRAVSFVIKWLFKIVAFIVTLPVRIVAAIVGAFKS